MKFFMIIVGLIMSAQAFAVSWEEVQNSPARYRIESPRIYFAPGVSMRMVDWAGEANMCVSGDQIYGGEHQRCYAYDDDKDRVSVKDCPANKLKTFHLYKDITGVRRICTENDDDGQSVPLRDCDPRKVLELPYTIDTNVKALIFDKFRMNDDDNGFLREGDAGYIGHVRVQLPACPE